MKAGDHRPPRAEVFRLVGKRSAPSRLEVVGRTLIRLPLGGRLSRTSRTPCPGSRMFHPSRYRRSRSAWTSAPTAFRLTARGSPCSTLSANAVTAADRSYEEGLKEKHRWHQRVTSRL